MKRTIPMRVKLLMIVPVVLALCGWYIYGYVMKRTHSDVAKVEAAPAKTTGQSGPQFGVAAVQPARFDPVSDAHNFVNMNTPRIAGLPHTSPKYDELTKPVRVPVPAACIVRRNMCHCLTQQGTPMDVGFNMCVSFAMNGWFQEFDADGAKRDVERTRDSVAVLSGKPDAPLPSHAGGHVSVVGDVLAGVPVGAAKF